MSKKMSKKSIKVSGLLTLLLAIGMVLGTFSASQAAGVPLISITDVTSDVSVTIKGTNFPLGQTFTARMGAYGTKGVGGVVVGSVDTGTSSTFSKTFNIPASLKGVASIAIRLDSAQGYYSYNWFVNKTGAITTGTITATATPPAATASATATAVKTIPTFSIVKIVKGTSVTIRTNNFPASQTFTARMGNYGTYGIGGTVVGTTPSGSGGTFEVTYSIPSALATAAKIAIRLESNLGFYAFNWFDNADSVAGAATSTPEVPSTALPGYTGIPKIFISGVVKDSKVSIQGTNFPAGQTFKVRMGAFGTLGVGGTEVTTFDSGTGGSFSATYTIPASLAGSTKVAIRLETANGHFYAYNWFYNTTTGN